MYHYLFHPTGGPGDGLFPSDLATRVCTNRTGGARVKGDVVQIDLAASATETTTFGPGTSTSIFANFVTPTAAAIAGTALTMFGVLTEDIADDASGVVAFGGGAAGIDAFVIGASGSMAVGTELVVTTAYNFDIVTATGEAIIGYGAEAVATPTSRTLGKVWFNGFALMGGVLSA